MTPPLMLLQNISARIGGVQLLRDARMQLMAGARMCLVGRNGSGKSTLLKIAAGLITPDAGERIMSSGATLRYLPQEPDLSGFDSVHAYAAAGLTPGDDAYRVDYLLEALGLNGQADPKTLSGGEARRAALAQVLAPQPDILLLDEPTNHLDLPAIEWLESELSQMRAAIVLVSHDRRFLQNLSRETLWLDRGVIRNLSQGFGEFEAWRDTVLEQEERDAHKLDRKIAMEEDWIRYGVTARRKRNQGRLRALAGLREQRRTASRATGAVKFTVSPNESAGKLVIEASNISKAYGPRVLVRDFSLRIQRGDRIGLLGPNGAGKTTLLKLLTGATPPDTGTVRITDTVQMVSLDQRRETLDPTATLRETINPGGGDSMTIAGQPKHVMSYMKDFLFTPDQAQAPVGVLSGGERGRLLLARALALPSNLLVLDEPTNDLDLETLDLLQEMLADYPGTVLLVSHDRDFIDRVATSVIAPDVAGKWIEYAGGYSDMLAQRGHGFAAISAPKSASKKPAAGPAKPAPAKPRLSFKDKHALETLPAQIAQLNSRIKAAQAKLADPGLFTRDPSGFAKLAAALEAMTHELGEAETRWLELEMQREGLE
ncbi:MAG TPA: ABC-F family ATP-binding cassette domain-containing protein [Alphaproteobacteria bacterium]|nr:ABC-F family ATP-binding cassette domain-containing protein [Alphaproteobacteria bacterium]